MVSFLQPCVLLLYAVALIPNIPVLMENDKHSLQQTFRMAELILLHRENRLGMEDAVRLQAWLSASELNRQLLEELNDDLTIQKFIHTYNSVTDAETAFETSIAPRLNQEGVKTQRATGYWIARAAAILLIPALLASLWYFRSRNGATTSPTANTPMSVPLNGAVRAGAGAILPGSERAVLTLADGRSLPLAEAPTGPLARQGSIGIDKTGQGLLTYGQEPQAAGGGDMTGYNTLVTPRGGTYKVVLPDGTTAWLNADSRLRYPVPFQGHRREVTLSGEAYFEVASHPREPFIVRLDNKNTHIEVLGTHFNVLAYEEEPICMTTVLQGSVKVAAGQLGSAAPFGIVLHSYQEAATDAGGIRSVRTNPRAADAAAWTSGRIAFAGRNIRLVMEDIARWYDVSVVYRGNMTDRAFEGSVSRETSLEDALKILSATNTVHFDIDKDSRRITVTP
jgi:ferric-dicitrate binding protein FerR (iron transport regulator)